jgi:hypothetical protein
MNKFYLRNALLASRILSAEDSHTGTAREDLAPVKVTIAQLATSNDCMSRGKSGCYDELTEVIFDELKKAGKKTGYKYTIKGSYADVLRTFFSSSSDAGSDSWSMLACAEFPKRCLSGIIEDLRTQVAAHPALTKEQKAAADEGINNVLSYIQKSSNEKLNRIIGNVGGLIDIGLKGQGITRPRLEGQVQILLEKLQKGECPSNTSISIVASSYRFLKSKQLSTPKLDDDIASFAEGIVKSKGLSAMIQVEAI